FVLVQSAYQQRSRGTRVARLTLGGRNWEGFSRAAGGSLMLVAGPKENVMPQVIKESLYRIGFFSSVADADRAVRNLLDAGFMKEQLGVICPEQFKGQLATDVPKAKAPGAGAAAALVRGGAAGAALGGVALAATALATGGVALIPAIPL